MTKAIIFLDQDTFKEYSKLSVALDIYDNIATSAILCITTKQGYVLKTSSCSEGTLVPSYTEVFQFVKQYTRKAA